jgi:uncharacterized membrane protein
LASIEEVMWLRLIVAVSLVAISLIPGAARSGGHSGGAGHGGGSPEAGAAASGMSGGGLALMSVAASGSYIFAGCEPCARALPKLLLL